MQAFQGIGVGNKPWQLASVVEKLAQKFYFLAIDGQMVWFLAHRFRSAKIGVCNLSTVFCEQNATLRQTVYLPKTTAYDTPMVTLANNLIAAVPILRVFRLEVRSAVGYGA